MVTKNLGSKQRIDSYFCYQSFWSPFIGLEVSATLVDGKVLVDSWQMIKNIRSLFQKNRMEDLMLVSDVHARDAALCEFSRLKFLIFNSL